MRYITPEAILQVRFAGRPRPAWDAAVLCFRGDTGGAALVDKLGARPVGVKTLYGMEETRERPLVWEAAAGGRRVVLVQGCLWGGPQAAILVEELACLGVRDIIGFGVAGGLVEAMRKGTQIVGARGIVIDTTARAYTSAETVLPDAALLAAAQHVAEGQGIGLVPARVTGVDALYRETPDDVRRWLGLGVDAINMETPTLYAAAAVCGIRAVWLGHISDTLSLEARRWESWQRPVAMTDVTTALTVALLEHLPSAASGT